MPRRVGTVSHISRRGTIVLRSEQTPPLGVEVVDKRVVPVGTIVDVFGPVKNPYVAVRPYSREELASRKTPSGRPVSRSLPDNWPHNLVGTVLYTVEQKRKPHREKRKRRR